MQWSLCVNAGVLIMCRLGLEPKDDLALLIELGMLYCPEVEFEDMNDCGCL